MLTRHVQLGNAVKLLREQQDLSVMVLAFKAGVDRKVIHSVERGSYNPSLVTLTVVSEALGLPLWQLLRFAERLGETVDTINEEQPLLRSEHWRVA